MSTANATKHVSSVPGALTVQWASGEVSEFASVWLRDNLREDRDPHSGQRLVDIADLPVEPKIRSAVADDTMVHVEWESEPCPASFDLEWLARHGRASAAARPELARRLWLEGAASEAARDFAWTSFAELRKDAPARLDWLTHLVQDGVAFLNGVPATDTAILEAASHVGQVAATNYGQVFDVRSVAQPENLAYSDLGLGLHTDNPYREPVPGFQVLHALLASVEGGESLFADGIALAEHLRVADAGAFAQLTQTAVPFLYRSQDAELYAERPLIQLSCRGDVTAVHYNSRSIAPLLMTAREARPFYAAYRRFAALLREPRFQMRFRLNSGDLVAFDNQRILHGRTGFSSARYPRHLRGCYLTRDSVYSEAALLRRRLPLRAGG
jgi:alpha-ketoglutarate-dependent taurine dioxygenase